MLLLWLVFAVLCAGSLYFILRPLLAAPPRSSADRQALNVQIYKERVAELASELAAGRLDEPAHAALKQELDLSLLADVHADPQTEKEPKHTPKARPVAALPWIIGLFILVPLASVALYSHLGQPTESGRWHAAHADNHPLADIIKAIDSATMKRDMPALQFAVQRLRAHLSDRPDNTEAWYTLGRTYLGLQENEAGLAALERALRLAPDDITLKVGLAQGILLSTEGKGNPRSEALLEEVLAQEPKHEGALMLAGFARFNAGQFPAAIALWERLKALRPPQSEGAKLLEQSIAEAKTRMTSQNKAAAPAAGSLEIAVSLSAALKAQIKEDDKVFVYARAAEGPPMPLAVATLSAGQLPQSVRLSDANAMMPNLKLSGFERIVVGARLSRSGSATPSAGDLEGSSATLVRSEIRAPIVIEISKVRP